MAQPDPLLRALGEVVRERRVALGISQEGLPDHIHRNTLGRLERASINTSVAQLNRIAAALDTTGSALLAEAEKRAAER